MTTTTRLHISGLTPSITQHDLKQRFSTFGDVKDVDGVGKLDGLGQPRKFAYITLESTREKLARCMNLLSGSTWKGAKLRIGEAKPDYKQRHELTITPPPPAPRPKLDALDLRRARLKRRLRAKRLIRGVQGREAKHMNPVTLENIEKHKGWRRTPLDHLIRPLRMRPLHPIPLPPKRSLGSKKMKTKPKKDRKEWRLLRARCTVIDPARYGVVHVSVNKGGLGDEFLFGGGVEELEVERVMEVEVQREPELELEVESTISGGESPEPVPQSNLLLAQVPSPLVVQKKPTPPPTLEHQSLPIISPTLDTPTTSLRKEKADTLALLGGLFTGEDWGGSESVSGDEIHVPVGVGDGDVEYEIVPRDADDSVNGGAGSDASGTKVDDVMDEDENDVQEEKDDSEEEGEGEGEEDSATEIQHDALKDMFKPQEESGGGFSLGLDVELDPDAETFLPASIQTQTQPQLQIITPAPTVSQSCTIQYTPDPRAIMFFPGVGKKDVFGVIEEKGWKWEHPGTSDEIRAKWDKKKVELTREYTRRHREAIKRKRRGGGTRGEDL